MTSWPDERQAIENMIEHFGGEGKVYAIVFDSYDYDNALNKVLPAVADAHKARGGTMVIRPDSGDPVECIISALRAGEKNFPTKKNMKGYKVIEGMAAIQGDGINCQSHRMSTLLSGVEAATGSWHAQRQRDALALCGGSVGAGRRGSLARLPHRRQAVNIFFRRVD